MQGLFDILGDEPTLTLYPWMESGEYKFILVTPENIEECIDACLNGKRGRFSLDLETTGIDNRVFDGETVDKIVGVCLSGDGITGWYIPLRHKKGVEHNIPWTLFEQHFRRLMDAVMADEVIAIFHNGKFDHEFLEHWGGPAFAMWDAPKRWEDTLILAYLRNTRAKRKSLKALSKASPDDDYTGIAGGNGLGMEMIELKDLFPEDHPKNQLDYSLLDPSQDGPRIYGCSDAICTYKLCDLLLPQVTQPTEHTFDQKFIYRIEKLCVASTRWMERNRIPTSPDKVMTLIKLGQQEWFDSIMTCYSEAEEILGRDVMPGYYKVLRDNWVHDDAMNLLPSQITVAKSMEARYYPNPMGMAESSGKRWPWIYDVCAPKQLGNMFEEMAVPGLVYTEKSGQVKTAKDVLDKIIAEAEARFPFMGKIKRFRETHKALGSYLFPMLDDVDPDDHTMRISFNAHRVDTGRFSTPAKEKDLASKKTKRIAGWPEINLQSMPATYDPRRPACMTRLRECIVARHGYYIVAIDFAGEELRLVTNLSHEPRWLEEFFRCSSCSRTFPRGDGRVTPKPPPARCPNCGSDKIGDLHTLTALGVYGDDALRRPEWKQLRGNAKGVNFALCYGGGGNAVVRSIGDIDINEGWRIKNQFDGTYGGLKTWWKGQHDFADKYGFVLTGFGRKYPVPDVWSAERMWRSKAQRNAVNGPIQGSGADIIKLAMGLVYKHCKKKGWLDKVKMIASMHDELVFEMHGSVMEEAIEEIVPLMCSNGVIKGKKWPVPLTCDTEVGPDWTVKWDLNEMKFRELRFDGNNKVKAPRKPDMKDWKGTAAEFDVAEAAFPGLEHAWEVLPHSFPKDLIPLFSKFLAGAPTPELPDDPNEPVDATLLVVDDDEKAEIKAKRAEVAALERAVDVPAGPPLGLKAGEFYDFVLRAPLTLTTVRDLADVIQRCQNSGTRKLRIKLPDGTVIEGWGDLSGQDTLVNETHFHILAKDRQL